jgi:hypothetical protein
MNKDVIRKLRSAWVFSAAFAAMAMLQAVADPVLPYTLPVATQLSNDVAVLEANPDRTSEEDKNLQDDRAALNSYRRTSKSLNTDVSILKDIQGLLADQPATYDDLVAGAIKDYLIDFHGRVDVLSEELLPAPLSKSKTNALNLLDDLYAKLADGVSVLDTDPKKSLKDLSKVASKLPKATNSVEKALKADLKYSSLLAMVGKINFKSNNGSTFGGLTNGTLDLVAYDSGTAPRGLQFHVEGITTNTPATYELAVDHNTATYSGTDVDKKFEYVFYAQPTGIDVTTNGIFTNVSRLTIEIFTTNFIYGSFRFNGMSVELTPQSKTNRVDVTNGLFQLNY